MCRAVFTECRCKQQKDFLRDYFMTAHLPVHLPGSGPGDLHGAVPGYRGIAGVGTARGGALVRQSVRSVGVRGGSVLAIGSWREGNSTVQGARKNDGGTESVLVRGAGGRLQSPGRAEGREGAAGRWRTFSSQFRNNVKR